MTIIEDRVVLTVGLLDLVEALRDQERLDAVAGHEGERGFEEIESAERWELVEHEQQPVRSCARVQLLGQAAPDLVEDEPDERLGPADVGWRNDQIERHRMGAFDQLPDPPVAATRHLSHHRIAVETAKRHRGRRSEEHTSELQSLMRISYAVFCLQK